jgi:exopolysaccharide biosynthesis polyprenyl glycosylphosphotransferase
VKVLRPTIQVLPASAGAAGGGVGAARAAAGRATAPAIVRLPLGPSLERRRLQVSLVLIVADALAVFATFATAGFIYFGTWLHPTVMLSAQVLVPIYWTVAISNGSYSAEAALNVRIGGVRALLALLLAAALILFLGYFLKTTHYFSRVVSTLSLLLAGGALLVGRDLLARFAAWRCGPTAINRLVLNDGGQHLELPHAYTVDAREHGLVPDIADPHALNRLGMFLRNMDRVIVSCPPERRGDWALILKGLNIEAEIVDDEVAALGAVGARRTPEYGALVIAIGTMGLRNRLLKRALDLVVATLVLLATAPLLLAVALAIKLEDRGPVLFVQRRLGRGNRFFRIYKFRSMRGGAEGRSGVRSTGRDDERVTRVGRFIRATSIDELPQLFNVLRGEMSLVGPRPHALGSHAGDKLFWEVDGRYWQRHSLKPGLTGLAQVRGLRGATDAEADLANRLQSDLEYIDGWTIWRDIAILFATVRVVVHRNAY